MSYDINYVKSQVRRAIETAPTKIKIIRTSWVSDGYGGKKRDKSNEVVADDLVCLVDNSTVPDLLSNATDAGRIFAQNGVKIFIMYDEGKIIRKEDIVEIKNSNRRYRVLEVHNLLEQNILIELKLEVND